MLDQVVFVGKLGNAEERHPRSELRLCRIDVLGTRLRLPL